MSKNTWLGWLVVPVLLIGVMGCEQPEDRPEAIRVDRPDPAEVDEEKDEPIEGEKETYILEPETELNFTGYYRGGSQHCSFLIFDGEINLVGQNPETADIYVHITMDSVMSESERLTEVLLDKGFFATETYPEGLFEADQVVEAEGENMYTITGDLTLRGNTVTIEFPAEIWWDDEALRITADFQVDRTWWEIGYDGIAGYAMRDRVDIEIDAVARTE